MARGLPAVADHCFILHTSYSLTGSDWCCLKKQLETRVFNQNSEAGVCVQSWKSWIFCAFPFSNRNWALTFLRWGCCKMLTTFPGRMSASCLASSELHPDAPSLPSPAVKICLQHRIPCCNVHSPCLNLNYHWMHSVIITGNRECYSRLGMSVESTCGCIFLSGCLPLLMRSACVCVCVCV